jgi:hypothetical protein
MDPGQLKIFIVRDVPRLRYVAEIILEDILGLPCDIVTDKRKLGKNPVINYSDEEIKGSFKIEPHPILFETGLTDFEPEVTEWRSLPVFFQTSPGSDLPFDIFAASFFLVTRYEEYLESEKDSNGRYRASSSFAFRKGFLQKPVVDLWARELAKSLILKFQNLVFRRTIFRSMVTIDVDQPFAYLGKDLIRTIGGIFQDVSHRTGRSGERYRTLAKGEKDPYDVFDYIFRVIEENGTDVRFFIPTGNRSSHDTNPSWQNEDYRKLIKMISGKFSIGLHPSFTASDNPSVLSGEKERLQNIISGGIDTSRFHYIKMHFPGSYRYLSEAGIHEDYSMGYPEEPGFRAGIARPFFFYDLPAEKKTELKIYPFQVMDGTLCHYRQMNADEADEVITAMINETRVAGGLFISIWHNTSLLDTPEWKEWRKIFEKMLKYQQ